MVKKLAELTPAEAERVEKFMKSMPKSGNFDRNGLAFDARHLDYIKSSIILLPLEYMAEYADQITWNAVQKNDENRIFHHLRRKIRNFETFTATEIGNHAY